MSLGTHLCVLLGSGFSKPAGLPLAREINNSFTRDNTETLLKFSSGEWKWWNYANEADRNNGRIGLEYLFYGYVLNEFVSAFIENSGGFSSYENFYQFVLDIDRNSPVFKGIYEKSIAKIQQRLSDFYAIRYNNGVLLPAVYNQLHQDSLTFINQELTSAKDERKIVVTHHAPTFQNYPEEYKGDPLNDAFATELHDLIDRAKIDYWIYGHHHRNIPDFNIGNTNILTNQLGYVKYNENKGFKNKCINIRQGCSILHKLLITI